MVGPRGITIDEPLITLKVEPSGSPVRPGQRVHAITIALAVLAISATIVIGDRADVREASSTGAQNSVLAEPAAGAEPARLRLTATIPLEGRTSAVLATADGIWTLSADAVQLIDPETNQVVATLPRADDAGFGGGFAHDGSSLWIEEEAVTWSTINGMFRLDPSTGARTGHWDFGSFLPTASLYADGYVWVGTGNLDDPGILRIDPRADGARRRIEVDGAVQELAGYRDEVWGLTFTADGMTDLFVVDTGTLESRVVTTLSAVGLAVGPTGVWVSGSGVHRIDPATGRVLQTINLEGVHHLAIADDVLWALSENKLSRIDATTGVITGTIDLDGGTDLAVRQGSVWVSDYGNGVTTPTGRLFRIDA